jgi:hypothetical protein
MEAGIATVGTETGAELSVADRGRLQYNRVSNIARPLYEATRALLGPYREFRHTHR